MKKVKQILPRTIKMRECTASICGVTSQGIHEVTELWTLPNMPAAIKKYDPFQNFPDIRTGAYKYMPDTLSSWTES
jgi:hypothetical protein